MRVALVACSASKRAANVPARDLYTGNLFRLSRDWVERRTTEHRRIFSGWGILSAKHGLVMPTQELGPYDLSLDSLTREELDRWSGLVRQGLADRWGLGTIYTVLAGADYRSALRDVPYVEDVFGGWLRIRRENEGKRGRVGIGWLMKQLKEDRHFG